jgi:GrpB-like predicted nucleotidyltransferase (UPF0157 family)
MLCRIARRDDAGCYTLIVMERVHFFRPTVEFLEQVHSLFEQHKQKILEAVTHAQVEHIGATSVPGELTKGDLDVQVKVDKEHFSLAVDQLKDVYEIHQPENWTSCYASFKDGVSPVLPVGIQVVIAGSEYDFFTRLRDILIAQPELLAQLNKLKSSFEGKDMESYKEAKGELL